jgi:multidrug efflux pump subunit AcrA (membrane-fusion protein)
MTTAKIDPQLKQTMQAQPNAEYMLLLRVDQIEASNQQALAARGVTIRRSLTLVPTLAVTCTGAVGLNLLDLSWIRRVEEDRPVYAL